MKEADIKIDDLEKEETKSEKKGNVKKEKNQEAVKKDDSAEILKENRNEDDKNDTENIKEKVVNKSTKKYKVLIGMVGKIRKGGEIELTDEDAEALLKEEYIEEV
ncbi:Uncharacterised protein [Sebaldella termitidis]|uniref:Uncharacterized protein n=1 Tax=Sebaldella termitidis (strain ATCC 33386 / NCTC 11300) TaxID=526218 RepID=D1AR43_SEBTE|nr:hypothetical protein [Sebaldella termitidis]ACZ07731.1 hypothetical protein Sterm_0859 [Sebaldella termitidis ATCC 33386]SUI23028.1 Uncharacterised protein [Sebaldella termitidis]